MTVEIEQRQFPCAECGATLTWDPGASALKCPYCGKVNTLPAAAPGAVAEQDFRAALALGRDSPPTETLETAKCPACAAEFSLPGAQRSRPCPFCGTPIVVETHAADHVKPGALLPFKVTAAEAGENYRRWLKKRWFAPSRLKSQAAAEGALAGMYVPYWTFDCQTSSRYTGQRGEDHYRTEHYTATEGSKRIQKTRRVKHTHWHPASGAVRRFFDDVLVLASRSLPQRSAEQLAPWDLENLVPYDGRYLSGFGSEAYQLDVATGFEAAKAEMANAIREDVRRDIGGDQQRVTSVDTDYSDITYKHLLLPIWLAAYRFDGKPYRFVVNGRTGECQGERPWSWLKIAAAAAAVVVIIGLIIWLATAQ